jgi:uncharacterized membrane protein YhaH (DUF805 family)
MTLYGGLLRLYPRSFREEYGEDMEQLLRLQLRDEGALRVWSRALLDLALTVPSLHLEARMSRGPSAPVVYGAASVASLVLAAVAGTAVGVSVLGIAGVLLFGSLAVIAHRRAQSLGSSGHADAHWWKYAVAGGALLALTAVAGTLADDDLGEGSWAVFMAVLLTSVVLLAVGLVLGVTHAVAHRRPRLSR